MKWKIKYSSVLLVYSIIMSVISVIGNSFIKSGDFSYLINTFQKNTLMSINMFLSISILFFCIGIVFINIFDIKSKKESYKILDYIFNKKAFFKCSLIILFFWLPYFLIFFPGILHYDSTVQLNNWYGVESWSTHHPVFSTFIIGIIIDIGKYFLSGSLGMAIYIIIQFSLTIITLAYSFKLMKDWNTPMIIRLIALIFFAFFPAFPIGSITILKDNVYWVFYLCLIYMFLNLINMNEKDSKKIYAKMSILICFLCLFRKEAIFMIFFIMCALLVFKKVFDKKIKRILLSCVLGILISIAITRNINYEI